MKQKKKQNIHFILNNCIGRNVVLKFCVDALPIGTTHYILVENRKQNEKTEYYITTTGKRLTKNIKYL